MNTRLMSLTLRFVSIILPALVTFGAVSGCGNSAHPETSLPPDVRTGDVELTITGLRNAKGQLLVSLFHTQEGFPSDAEKAIRKEKIDLAGDVIKVTLKDVPFGVYAVAALHDENLNGRMDSGFFGIPKEGAGVSMNPKQRMGPPLFQDATFKLETTSLALDIVLRYP